MCLLSSSLIYHFTSYFLLRFLFLITFFFLTCFSFSILEGYDLISREEQQDAARPKMNNPIGTIFFFHAIIFWESGQYFHFHIVSCNLLPVSLPHEKNAKNECTTYKTANFNQVDDKFSQWLEINKRTWIRHQSKLCMCYRRQIFDKERHTVKYSWWRRLNRLWTDNLHTLAEHRTSINDYGNVRI